jgi:hypothetical protein
MIHFKIPVFSIWSLQCYFNLWTKLKVASDWKEYALYTHSGVRAVANRFKEGGGSIVLYLPTKLKFGDHLCTFSEVCVDGGEEVKFS